MNGPDALKLENAELHERIATLNAAMPISASLDADAVPRREVIHVAHALPPATI